MSSDAAELLETLGNRRPMLEALADERLDQQELTDRTAASQPTISRSLSEFRDRGIVSRTDNEYQLTLFGRLVYRTYESYCSTFEQLAAADEILADLPAEVALDPDLLENCEITTSDPHAPDAALSPLLGLTREATEIRGVATMFHAGYSEPFNDRMREGDLAAEFVMTEEVLDRADRVREDLYRPLATSERIDMYKIRQDIPYSLVLLRTESEELYTVVVVSSDDGTHGTIVNDDPDVYEWGREQYQQYKAEATPWRPPASSGN